MRRKTLCNGLLLLAAVLFLSAGNLPAGTPGDRFTVDDLLKLESASQFDISRDGRYVAWVKTSPDPKANKTIRRIMLADLEDTTTVQLTRGTRDDFSPKFSPDGTKLAFLRRGKGKTQIYVFDMRGGEPEKLTSSRTGVNGFAWRDPAGILFSAREDSTLRERSLKQAKDDVVVVADQEHYAPVRLFSIVLDGKKVTRITTNRGRITEFSISPDGRWVVTGENQSIDYGYDNRVPPKQFLIDLRSGSRKEIFTGKNDNPSDFKWTLDSKGFYCRKSYASDPNDTYVSVDHLYYYDLATGESTRVPLDRDKGLGYPYLVSERGLLVTLPRGTEDEPALLTVEQRRYAKNTLTSPSGKPIRLQAWSRNGELVVYLASDASSLPEIMCARLEGGRITGEFRLAGLNESLEKKTFSRTEIIRWRGARGDMIDGILYYPPQYEKGKRFPLIALIHGGPTGVDRNFFTERWSNYPHLLAAQGAFVLKVNYHGSGNYGLKWMESIKGRYYELEVPDIIKGVDHVIRMGLADGKKLGIMGWSNGSILAIECCLRSNRFRALCAGAGDVNWTSDYGNCAFGAAFDNAYFGGPPWKKLKTYIEKSPLFKMHKTKTPTLIMFGTEDTNVPTQQGWEHFRALQQIGKAPVRFLLFPGETHGFRKLSHKRRKIEEELAWFRRYLFGEQEEKNEAFDERSRLALAIAKEKSKKSLGFFGEAQGHILVPETVPFKNVRVGRFEVTRAQYKAFDMDYDFEPGTGNFPVSDISFEKAQAYCAWLSERTGRTFRLPRESEMKELLSLVKSRPGEENNVVYWAGYDPTPDEYEMLKPKIGELEKTRLLLLEVGSFAPAGKTGIYDLGGNVAEWVSTEKGGKVMGPSAISPIDERTAYSPPPSRYVGFRVCEEPPGETGD